MPYTKEIGHSPVYIKRCITRSYTLQKCKAIARHLEAPYRIPHRIPHTRSGATLTFEDSYEAYILEVEKMSPWQKFIDHIYL